MTSPAVVVFTGPTLTPAEGAKHLQATWLPPAGQGDVYAVARQRPWGIGIIDGYFERVPSVWHKEILWAMSQGVHVFGAASMGALRATELEAYGMEGVGRVYEAYRDGEIEDDDEVAVTHAPEELGFRVVSEAMVNIRATVAAALAAGVVEERLAGVVLRAAKARHYSRRRWDEILAEVEPECGPQARQHLQRWLGENRVDQKGDDAVAMLEHIAKRMARDRRPKSVTFTFQCTDSWQQVREQVDDRDPGRRAGSDTELPDAALEEMRLLGAATLDHRERALARLLALELAERIGVRPGAAAVEKAREALCERQGLQQQPDLDAWLDAQALTPSDLERLLRDQARCRRVEEIAAVVLPSYLRDWLRVEGLYGALLARARDKQRVLRKARLDRPLPTDTGLAEGTIWEWYFRDHLDRDVPEDVTEWARQHDFAGEHELHLAVLRERCYQQLVQPRAAPGRATAVELPE